MYATVRRGSIFTSKAPESVWRPGSLPAGGAYNAPSHPAAGFKGQGSREGEGNGKVEREAENEREGTEGRKEGKGDGEELFPTRNRSLSVPLFVRLRCADVSPTKYEKCFGDGVCLVTYGEAMNQSAARHFCAKLSNTSILPTISNHTRKLLFDRFLGSASTVTDNQPVWLDIHRKPPGFVCHFLLSSKNISCN